MRDANLVGASADTTMLKQITVCEGQLVPFPGDPRKILLLGGYRPTSHGNVQAGNDGNSGASMGDHDKDTWLFGLDLDSLVPQMVKITNAGTGDYTPSLGIKGTAYTVDVPGAESVVFCSGGYQTQPKFPFELRAAGRNLNMRFLSDDSATLRQFMSNERIMVDAQGS